MPTDAELMAEWQASQTPAQESLSLFSPAANDLLAVGNRAVEGLGSAADFWEATERNLNPFRYGGPRAFGLNENIFNVPPAESPSVGIKDIAESAYLYGPEKAQTTVGKFLEPGAELVASSVGPGFSSIAVKPLLVAAGLGGLLNVGGADEQTQKLTEAAVLTGPGLAKAGAQGITKGVGALQRLTGLGKGIDETAKEAGKAVSRSAFSVRASDYTKDIEELGPWVLDVPEGQIASKVKNTLDDLISKNVFQGDYTPKNIVKTSLEAKATLAESIDDVVREAEKNLPAGIEPKFTKAEQYITSGKIADPDWARGEIQKYKDNIAKEGFGSLSYIQQQKIAAGDTYEVGQKAKNGLYRAIYHDLQKTVEKYAPGVAPLNKELAKWEQLTPIFARSLGADEKKDLVSWLAQNLRTSGGTLTTPTLITSAVTGGVLGPAAIIPGLAMGAAYSSPGRVAIGKTLTSLGEMPSIPQNFPAGLANLFSIGGSSPTDEELLKEWEANASSKDIQTQRSLEPVQMSGGDPVNQFLPGPNNQIDKLSQGAQPTAKSRAIDRQEIGQISRGLDRADMETPVLPSSDYTSKRDSKATTEKPAKIAHILDVPDMTDAKDIKQVEQAIDADPYYSALYEAESGRNPSAKNPTSSASGGFQFIKETAKNLGLKDPMDLGQSFEAVQRMTNDHKEEFGEDPARLYAAHYLGATLLRKWLGGGSLTNKETELVKGFKNQALPRFMKIYSKVNTLEV